MSTSPTGNDVLRSFIASANKQYRDAGLHQYQMRVDRDGTVSIPRSQAGFKAPSASGSAAPEQAKAGAAPAPAPAGASGATAADPSRAKRTGQPLKVVDLQQSGSEAFKIGWQPIQGARQYGVWQDGQLIGHVTQPSFAANLAVGASGTIQVDAVRADGTRTPLTRALRVARTPEGKITFDVPGATAPAAGAATAPAAPAR